jgi:hypothetical protein
MPDCPSVRRQTIVCARESEILNRFLRFNGIPAVLRGPLPIPPPPPDDVL